VAKKGKAKDQQGKCHNGRLASCSCESKASGKWQVARQSEAIGTWQGKARLVASGKWQGKARLVAR